MSRIVGIDPSLTGTGIAVVNGRAVQSAYRLEIRPRNLIGLERLDAILDCVIDEVYHSGGDTDLVVIEGPAYSKGADPGAHERAGLWWMLRYRLWRRDMPVAVLTPGQLKKYVSGNGTAGKDLVLASVVRRYGHLVEVNDNDTADALVLAAAGADHLGEPLTIVPRGHRAALDKVLWPELRDG